MVFRELGFLTAREEVMLPSLFFLMNLANVPPLWRATVLVVSEKMTVAKLPYRELGFLLPYTCCMSFMGGRLSSESSLTPHDMEL